MQVRRYHGADEGTGCREALGGAGRVWRRFRCGRNNQTDALTAGREGAVDRGESNVPTEDARWAAQTHRSH